MTLKNIIKVLENKKKEEREEYLEEKREKQKRNRLIKKEKETENKKLKLECLMKIEKWILKFLKTKEFKEIMDFIKKHNKKALIIYYSNWGHFSSYLDKELDRKNWARIELNLNSELEYKSGYSWLGYRACFKLNKKNIDKIKHSYLKKFYRYLSSNEIYETIEEEIKHI